MDPIDAIDDELARAILVATPPIQVYQAQAQDMMRYDDFKNPLQDGLYFHSGTNCFYYNQNQENQHLTQIGDPSRVLTVNHLVDMVAQDIFNTIPGKASNITNPSKQRILDQNSELFTKILDTYSL
jgi:hypothetical protein